MVSGLTLLRERQLALESANYSTPYRRYYPAIGRLLGVDPLTDAYHTLFGPAPRRRISTARANHLILFFPFTLRIP